MSTAAPKQRTTARAWLRRAALTCLWVAALAAAAHRASDLVLAKGVMSSSPFIVRMALAVGADPMTVVPPVGDPRGSSACVPIVREAALQGRLHPSRDSAAVVRLIGAAGGDDDLGLGSEPDLLLMVATSARERAHSLPGAAESVPAAQVLCGAGMPVAGFHGPYDRDLHTGIEAAYRSALRERIVAASGALALARGRRQ